MLFTSNLPDMSKKISNFYELQSIEVFNRELNNYLKQYPLITYEESLLKNFSSSNLSDLYKLFLDLEDSKIDKELFYKLKEIISTYFSIDINDIFGVDNKLRSPFEFSKKYTYQLASIIKDKFLSLYNNNSKNFDEKELYKMSVIVNKVFPEVFLQFIKQPNSDINKIKAFIEEQVFSTVENCAYNNSKEAYEEDRDILGGTEIVIEDVSPEVTSDQPGRIKSPRSSKINIIKEVTNNIYSIMPSDLSTGITYDDVQRQFDLAGANNDFFAFTIVIKDIKDTLYLGNSSLEISIDLVPEKSNSSNIKNKNFTKKIPSNSEITSLRKLRADNITFLNNLEDFLLENTYSYLSNLQLLQIQIDLLTRLRASTYEKCVREYKDTSFTQLLKYTIKKYNQELKNSTNEPLTDDGISLEEDLLYKDELSNTSQLDNIYELIGELKERIDDKYYSALSSTFLPDILEHQLFTETLKITHIYLKTRIKKNGYCSDYYILTTSDGRKIELQVQSEKRFKDSKNGPSDHSKLSNKSINIFEFFEPVNKDCNIEQFNNFLKILNDTPLAKKETLYNTPDRLLSSNDKKLKTSLKIAERNVKLKDFFDFEYAIVDENSTKNATKIVRYTIEQYLPMYAEYVSPILMSSSAHPTRYSDGVAAFHKNSLISGFTEALLIGDSTTFLGHLLIDKLVSLTPANKNEITKAGIMRRAAQRHNSSKFNNKDTER